MREHAFIEEQTGNIHEDIIKKLQKSTRTAWGRQGVGDGLIAVEVLGLVLPEGAQY